MRSSNVSVKSDLKLTVGKRHAVPARALSVWEIFKYGFPHFGLSSEVALYRLRNLPNLCRGLWRLLIARFFGVPTHTGYLALTVTRGNGQAVDLGLVSLRLVTTAGVTFIRDCFLGTQEAEDMNFHGFGTGNNAENASDTALQTELTTQYAVDNTRPTGTPVSGGVGAYRTTATLSPDANVTITEHGVFDQASNAGGTLLDRSVFTGVPLVGGVDALTTQYTITFATGA